MQITLPHGATRLVHQTIGVTLLLGWDSGRDVFAAFDAWRYRAFGHSPSVQASEGTLQVAKKTGWSEEHKQTGRVIQRVIAFQPAQIGRYVEDLLKRRTHPQVIRTRVIPDELHEGSLLATGPEALAIRVGDYVIALDENDAPVEDTIWTAGGDLAVREIQGGTQGRMQRAVELSLKPTADIIDMAWAKKN